MKKLALVALMTAVTAPVVVPQVAFAQDYRTDRDSNGNEYRSYRGNNGHYYRCKKSSGTTGLIAGGAGGALVGNALGGGLLGTVAGGVGGALLGKHLDKKHDAAQNRKNGC